NLPCVFHIQVEGRGPEHRIRQTQRPCGGTYRAQQEVGKTEACRVPVRRIEGGLAGKGEHAPLVLISELIVAIAANLAAEFERMYSVDPGKIVYSLKCVVAVRERSQGILAKA